MTAPDVMLHHHLVQLSHSFFHSFALFSYSLNVPFVLSINVFFVYCPRLCRKEAALKKKREEQERKEAEIKRKYLVRAPSPQTPPHTYNCYKQYYLLLPLNARPHPNYASLIPSHDALS